MGEIRDARYNLIKTYELFAHDVANGKFFRDIAANPEWFRKDEPDVGDFIDATEATRGFATIANIEWVKVPSGNIEKTNVPRWGALAGGYVRAPIWRDLNELEKMQNPGYWGHILRFWKANKTARSPTVHFNNFVGNVILSELYDFTPGDLVRAMREYRQQGHLYQEAIQNGVFDSGYVRAELLGGSNARELIDQVIKEVEASEEIKMGSMWRLWEIITNANRKMERAYQWEDEIFRLVSFMHDKAMGMSTSEAAENAINRFMNYDIRAPLPNMLRKTVFPFLSYTYAFVPAWFKAVSNKPWKIAKVASIGYAIAALSDMLVEGEPEDERRVMSERETGVTWAGLPKTLRNPLRNQGRRPDVHGSPESPAGRRTDRCGRGTRLRSPRMAADFRPDADGGRDVPEPHLVQRAGYSRSGGHRHGEDPQADDVPVAGDDAECAVDPRFLELADAVEVDQRRDRHLRAQFLAGDRRRQAVRTEAVPVRLRRPAGVPDDGHRPGHERVSQETVEIEYGQKQW